MAKLLISAKIKRVKEYGYLRKLFGAGYLRQIDKFFTIRRKSIIYLVNTYFPRNVLLINQRKYLAVLELFSEPLPFMVFLDKLRNAFDLNYSDPTADDILKITELLTFTKLLVNNLFIVTEIFNEYNQLQKIRKQVMFTEKYPSAIYIIPSLDCNFRCPGCYVYAYGIDKKKMIAMTSKTFDRQLKFVLKAYPRKRGYERTFVFYGGEPLMNKKLVEYAARKIQKLKKDGVLPDAKLSIVTNGSLIDDATAKMLKRNKISVGISMDGVGKTNDRRRKFTNGSGTFDAIMKAVDILKRNGIDYGLSWTIGMDNIDSVSDDLAWVAKHLGRPGIFFNFMVGNEKTGDPFKKLTSATFFRKMHAIYDKMRELGLKEGRVNRYMRWAQKDDIPYYFYCSAVSGGQFVLHPNGNIGICQAGLMREEKQFQCTEDIGDITRDPVWLEWLDRTPPFIKDCYQYCNHFSLCPGGCPYRVKEVKGSMYATVKAVCIVEQFLIERGIVELCEKDPHSTKKRMPQE